MKRLLALLCIAALGINLCGCSLIFRYLKDRPALEEITPDIQITFPQQELPTAAPPVVTMPEIIVPTMPTLSPEIEEKVSYIGAYENGVYENYFFNIACPLDDQWVVFNEEQLAQLIGVTADMLNNDFLKQQMENGTVVYGLYAQTSDGLMNLNICIEKLNTINGILIDEEDYINGTMHQLPAALESIGMEDIQLNPTTMYFAGSEHAALQIQGTLQGMPFYETGVCVKMGEYIAFVTAASSFVDSTAEVLSMFEPAA